MKIRQKTIFSAVVFDPQSPPEGVAVHNETGIIPNELSPEYWPTAVRGDLIVTGAGGRLFVIRASYFDDTWEVVEQ